MRRSVSVPLMILGGLGVGVCTRSTDVDVHQQVYSSQEECERDWGDSKSCKQDSGSSGAHGAGGRWYGPRYYWNRDLQKPVQLNADGSTQVMYNSRITAASSSSHNTSHVGSVSRGGFGGSSHSGGG